MSLSQYPFLVEISLINSGAVADIHSRYYISFLALLGVGETITGNLNSSVGKVQYLMVECSTACSLQKPGHLNKLLGMVLWRGDSSLWSTISGVPLVLGQIRSLLCLIILFSVSGILLLVSEIKDRDTILLATKNLYHLSCCILRVGDNRRRMRSRRLFLVFLIFGSLEGGRFLLNTPRSLNT